MTRFLATIVIDLYTVFFPVIFVGGGGGGGGCKHGEKQEVSVMGKARNPMSNKFRKISILKNIWIMKLNILSQRDYCSRKPAFQSL